MVITNQTDQDDLKIKQEAALKEDPENQPALDEEIDNDPDLQTDDPTNDDQDTPSDDKAGEPVDNPDDKADAPTTPPVTTDNPDKKPGDVDYRTKFIESQKEAMVIRSRNNQLTQAYEEANKIAEPTDEDMKKKYPNWEDLDETTKSLAKESYVNAQKLNIVGEVVNTSKKTDEWANSVKDFIDNPENMQKFSGLAGREAEFFAFTQKPSRVGGVIEDQVAAFLFGVSSVTGDVNNNAQKRTQLFNHGGGGDKPTQNKPTAADVERLRRTNPREWLRRTRKGEFNHLI